MLKILHTADWHLGNFPCPASKDGTNLRFKDICGYIEFLIGKANDMKPDIIIIAGDVFHQAKTWSDRGLQETNTIIGYINRLADIAPTCILRGTPNHDGKMHFDLLNTALGNNQNVIIVDEPCVKNVNNLAAIAFVPIFDRNLFRATSAETLDKEAENNFFCDKVRDAILDLKPQADAFNLPTILVTHYTVLGATMPNGQTSIFANHEVVIDPMTLIQGNYWLTCLGHIHKPQQLETCSHAFYSGSLCALTFNDENDRHGFYMHYVNSQDDIQSEFIETPSREFVTIWFNDAQLNDIMSRNYDVSGYIDAADCHDNIIRVIYSCTDITNKKLNKALLEKAIYTAAEPFYVQEITPAEIAVTVDKTAMRNTVSIADNLRVFLTNEMQENQTLTPNQIEDCVQLAQPIIDELTADTTANQNIGVFTPIEIEVKNYRNYKSAVFNYKDVRFCVINGENGAGKSSLFMDAMLDALFEETREGDITGWISNDIDARSGSIKFTFSIGDNIYKITRTRQKSGKATLNLAQHFIDENGDEGWNDLSEDRIKDTQYAIDKLIGMDAVTLKSCGLIMQDAYGLFLQADKTTRMDILGNILGLGIYNDLCDSVAEFNTICQREITKANDEENGILSRIKDGEAIQKQLDDAYIANSSYETELKDCNNTLIINTSKREALVKDIECYNRLCNEIDTLTAKKASDEKTLAEQRTISANAAEIIATENNVAAITRNYNTLTETERELTAKYNQIAPAITARGKLDEELNRLTIVDGDADNKLSILNHKKQDIEIELSTADDISQKASLYEITKQEIAEAESKLTEIRSLEETRRSHENSFAEIKHAHQTKMADFDAKFADIDKKNKIMAESGCPAIENATCKFLADAKQTVAALPSLKDAYNAEIIAFEQVKSSIESSIADCDDKIRALRENLPDIERKKQELAVYENCAFKAASMTELKNTLAVYEQQIANFIEVKAENAAKREKIIAEYNELTQTIVNLTQETSSLDKVRADIAAIGDINMLTNRIAENKAVKTAADKRIEELTRDIQCIDFDTFDKMRERSQLNINDIGISEIDANIFACQERQALLSQNISENGKIIGMLESDMKQYKDDIRQLDKLKLLKDKTSYMASNAGWLKKAFSRNGIPHNIIRSVIPVLETTASNILNQMSKNTMSIELRTEKTLSTKKEIATLDVIVCDTITGDLPYLSRSGGERVKAALSVVLALAEIKSSESGTQLGFLFIDEPPFLDSNGCEAYCDALEAIQKRYANLKIMAITHDPEMKSRFNQSIDVVKTGSGSEIHTNL